MAVRTSLWTEDKASVGKNIEGSLLCVSGESPELRRTILNDGDRRCWTKSFWIRRGHVDRRMLFGCYSSGSNTAVIEINGDGDLHWYDYVSSYRLRINTTALIRDPAAWYHIVCVMDTHEITDSERARLYINGERITHFQNVTYPDLELEGIFNTGGIEHDWFTEGANKRLHYDGFITDIHELDGIALDSSYFGYTDPLTNTWKPKKYNYKVSPNITSTAYAIKSSEQSSDGQIATNAFDGDLEDAYAARWRNNGSEDSNIVNNAYIGQNFGSGNTKHIREIRLLQGRASSTGEMVTGVKVQYSDNGSSWSDAGSAHTINASTFAWQTIKVASTGAHQYWRLLCTASSNSVWLVTELKMHEYTLQPSYGPNGYHLPLDGSGPIGKDQSGQVNPNDGTNWSSKHSGTIYGGAATDVFDGTDLTDKASVNSSDSAQNHFTISSISVTASSVRVFVSNCSSNIEVSINGSVVGTISSSDIGDNARGTGFRFAFTQAVVTSIKVRRVGSTSGWFIYGIQLDDIDLIDDKFGNDWSVHNIQSSVSVKRATGALPILDTVCDGMISTSGIRTDSSSPGKLVLAIPCAGIATDVSHRLNGGTSYKALTLNSVAKDDAQTNFYSSAVQLGSAGDYIAVPGTDLAFGTGDFTIEFWLYHTSSGSNNPIFDFRGGATNGHILRQTAATTFEFRFGNSAIGSGFTSGNQSKWNHYAVVRNSGVTKIYVNGVQAYSATDTNNASSTGTKYFNANDDDQSIGVTGNWQDIRVYKGLAKYTSNFIPASTQPAITIDSPTGTDYPYETDITVDGVECGSAVFDSVSDHIAVADHADLDVAAGDHCVECWVYPEIASQANYGCIFSKGAAYQLYYKEDVDGLALFVEAAPDGSSYIVNQANIPAHMSKRQWYHVAVSRQSNTWRVFVNGQLKWTDSASGTVRDVSDVLSIGTYAAGSNYEIGGFISNFRLVKGSAVYTANFIPPKGPLTAITNTKLLCCQSPKHPTNSTITPSTITTSGNVYSSTFNPFKASTNGRPGLYPTLNRLAASDVVNNSIYYGNNLQEGDNYNKWMPNFVFGPGYITTGKYYWEITWKGGNGTSIGYAGVTGDFEQDSGEIASQSARNWMGSASYINYTATSSSSDSTFGAYEGQTYGYAVDLDNNKMYFYRDNHLIHTDTTIPDADTTFFRPSSITTNDGASGANWCDAHWNWGQRPLRYPPPSGYKSLNFANLRPNSSVSIVRPDQHVGIVTYTGDGANNRQVTGFNFQPDLLWIKSYSATANWGVYDSVRGVATRGQLDDDAHMDAVPIGSFDHNGYSIATEQYYNASGGRYIAYGWKGGGNKATWNVDGVGYASVTAAGLDGGSINPTGASVNTKAGFSIIRYEATSSNPESFEHGLTRKPEFMICKKTGASGKAGGGGDRGWSTYHHSLADGKVLFMDTIDDIWNEPNFWHNSGGVTNSLVYVGNDYNTGEDGVEYMHYSWHGVPGYSQFGMYHGNGSTAGVFVATSFRPALLMIKRYDADENWMVMTPKLCDLMNAGGGNFIDSHLRTDSTGAEQNPGGSPAVAIDILSNGFKQYQTSAQVNSDGATYIYCAWADQPLNTLYGGQVNAR